jgi:murein DD-endopeptidase MepM/ murein hydrolase activator NlpD
MSKPIKNIFNHITAWNSFPGSFGFVRKYDIHTGVDLYCDEFEPVFAIEGGQVVAIERFTGPSAEDPSPWWNDTKAILVEGKSGVIVYGEIEPVKGISTGLYIEQGQYIANVLKVLKKNKGMHTSMLHVELYTSGTRNTVWWRQGDKPAQLLDPTNLISSLYAN